MTVGLISDTHGLLRPTATAALRHSDVILHAGDIGGVQVIDGLQNIAPVSAVRGNADKGDWALRFPKTLFLQLAGTSIFVLHDIKDWETYAEARRSQIVISGHSHRAGYFNERDILFVNPGSAGPRRFRLPVTAGRLHLGSGPARVELIELTE